jgi:hypothetical protein
MWYYVSFFVLHPHHNTKASDENTESSISFDIIHLWIYMYPKGL